MAYWLFKSEPETWGWEKQKARGDAGEPWDGVRNYLARNNMREMRLGDLGFFYHSVKEKSIVGVVEVCGEIAPDPKTDDPRWECVTIRAVADMPRPVTLADVKAEPALAEMALVKTSRLSVQPVTPEEWAIVCRMGGYRT
ncbi:EVE domain-containing protein [Rubrimonas cliftonensis]|uniref:Predicted RNA-binding protein, contains PUA-like domain n=1 Tax=Rubrimonas cliftonensis TaxID=89524 RepID=A0A1H4A0X7_9RHOB|nr:EVE domain-containing protein [Rubrimonas cliftonensis]SEA29172.1 Predicted RNA-binding protein, contains PUA-like domain [Rubrimonas cliftonensis]